MREARRLSGPAPSQEPAYVASCPTLPPVRLRASRRSCSRRPSVERPRPTPRCSAGCGGLVAAKGGPPGAVATLYSDGRLTVADGRPRRTSACAARQRDDHMRLASVTKAFTGAVVLRLVDRGALGLDDTVGQRLPGMPLDWQAVTIRQLLNHTSGLPTTRSPTGFVNQFETDPKGYVSPSDDHRLGAHDPLVFPPGTQYEYSNTDNIIVALIAEAVTGRPYPNLLEDIVFDPAELGRRRSRPGPHSCRSRSSTATRRPGDARRRT